MARRIWPEQYLKAGYERARDAQLLLRKERYAHALYTSGVAGECIIHAFRTLDDAQFDEGHDLMELLKGCDRRRFDGVRNKFDGAVATLRRLWSNDYRYHSTELVLTRLRKQKLTRGIDGDPVKFYASEATDAAQTLIKLGRQLWRRETS